MKNMCAAIEAVLFASGEPIDAAKIALALESDEETINTLIKTMITSYDNDKSGLQIYELNDSFQLCTKPIYAGAVKAALDIKRNVPLSQAAMEILAIIAYNQPVTKSFIEQVRGVDSSQSVNNLVEKGLVEEAGRLDLPGRPIAYQTTNNFLRTFSLKSLDNLPPLPDDSGQVMLDDIVSAQNDIEQ
ncbi:MAG: SMC-Scp complex subunit ScpB [Oscillospiraceae bacterium]